MRGCEQVPWLYDGLMVIYEGFGLDRWRHRLLAGARGRVLEVGCGTGRNLPLYAEGRPVVACDIDLGLLLAARRRAPGTPLILASTEALPFRAASFDTTISSLVFCSVPDPQRGLREIARVLERDGELRMMEHVRHKNPAIGRIQDLVQPFWTCLSGGCHVNRDTEANVEQAGWRIEKATRRARGAMRLFNAHLRG